MFILETQKLNHTCICHTDNSSIVFQHKIFISKFFAVNGYPTGTIPLLKVTALHHELRDHAMKYRALVVQQFLAARVHMISDAQSPEILSSLWRYLFIEFNENGAQWF